MSLAGISIETKEGQAPSLTLRLNLRKPGYQPKAFTTIDECAAEFVRMWNECDGGKRADGDNYTLMIANDPVMGAIHERLVNELPLWTERLKVDRKLSSETPHWVLALMNLAVKECELKSGTVVPKV